MLSAHSKSVTTMSSSEALAAKEHYEERAAIYEYDARIDRSKAESMALRDVSVKYGQQVAKQVKEMWQ